MKISHLLFLFCISLFAACKKDDNPDVSGVTTLKYDNDNASGPPSQNPGLGIPHQLESAIPIFGYLGCRTCRSGMPGDALEGARRS